MEFIVTGVPGAGKTLNTIKQVLSEDRFKNRPVYFCGIDGCVVPGWVELTYDQAKNWESEVPPNSILIIDEAYKFAPVGATGIRPPAYIEKLAEHRHAGIDIFLICQHATQLHTFVRKMCGNHYHYDRAFGFQRSRRYEWQKLGDPDDFHSRKDAVVKDIPFDKKIFNLYKSAEVHTHKRRIPKKLVLVLLAMVTAASLFGVLAYRLKNHETVLPASVSSASVGSIISGGGDSRHVMTREQYVAQFQPRVKGLAYTAPIYDQAFKVRTFPKPSCVINNSTQECRCYSQQGTRMETEPGLCTKFAVFGWFDPTKDEEREDRGAQRRAEQPVRQPEQNKWLVIDQTPVPGTSEAPVDADVATRAASLARSRRTSL